MDDLNTLLNEVEECIEKLNELSYELSLVGYQMNINPTYYEEDYKGEKIKFRAIRAEVVRKARRIGFANLKAYVDHREREELNRD